MNCRQVFLLDENIIHPNCYQCGKELSIYQIEDEIPYQMLEYFKLADLWLWEKNGKHTVMLCSNCVKIEGE